MQDQELLTCSLGFSDRFVWEPSRTPSQVPGFHSVLVNTKEALSFDKLTITVRALTGEVGARMGSRW